MRRYLLRRDNNIAYKYRVFWNFQHHLHFLEKGKSHK